MSWFNDLDGFLGLGDYDSRAFDVYDEFGNRLDVYSGRLDMDYCTRPPAPGQHATQVGYDYKGSAVWIKGGTGAGDPGHEASETFAPFIAIAWGLVTAAIVFGSPWNITWILVRLVVVVVLLVFAMWAFNSRWEPGDWEDWGTRAQLEDLWREENLGLTDAELSEIQVGVGETYGFGEVSNW